MACFLSRSSTVLSGHPLQQLCMAASFESVMCTDVLPNAALCFPMADVVMQKQYARRYACADTAHDGLSYSGGSMSRRLFCTGCSRPLHRHTCLDSETGYYDQVEVQVAGWLVGFSMCLWKFRQYQAACQCCSLRGCSCKPYLLGALAWR